MNICGQERLLYKARPIDIVFIRGTYADEYGNVTMEHECCYGEATAIAQAAKNSGGKVIVQVEKVVQDVDPKLVKVAGIYVDAVVITENEENHTQCVGCEYDGSMAGEFRAPVGSLKYPALSPKKIIGRRAAMELKPDTIVNLGIGIPEYVSMVASEEGIDDHFTLTVEAGPIGGIPQGGPKFGGSVNTFAIVDQPVQFDFYDGGGIDDAFLGLAQADEAGNINVSKFGRNCRMRRICQYYAKRKTGLFLRYIYSRRPEMLHKRRKTYHRSGRQVRQISQRSRANYFQRQICF